MIGIGAAASRPLPHHPACGSAPGDSSKHSPAGGTAEIALEQQPGALLVQVLDRGPGVDPFDLQTIFEPFYRSHPLTNNLDGHGLGLAIAQRVVAAHGGTIAAANRDGGGLCVTVTLPLAQAG